MADKLNLGFLRGTQTNFDKLSAYQAGAFYLTTDTNRLYYADSASKVSYLNKYVHTVTNAAALAAAITAKEVNDGDFVYVSDVNALVAIDSAKANGYVQVNAYTDTDTDTQFVSSSFNTEVSADKSYITITETVNLNRKDVKSGKSLGTETKTASFKINNSDIAAITPTVGVNVAASVAGGVATVKTTGTGAAGDGYKIKTSGSVAISSDGADGFVLTGTNSESTLSSTGGTINLKESTGESSAVTIEGGTEIVVAAGDETNHIEVSHATITRAADTATGGGIKEYSTSFDVIDDVTLENGHVTKVNKKTITMPTEHKYTITGVQGEASGKITIKLKDSTGPEQVYTSDNQSLYFLVDGNKVYNQGALDVYTTAQIDEKFKGLNAMIYRGTVDGDNPLPTSKVQTGDVYMVASVGSYGPDSTICEVGDLWIATGTEDDNGYITAASLKWTYVPAGDDTDTQYSLETTNNGLNLKNTTTNQSAGSATFSGSKKVIMTKSGTNFDFAHATQTVSKAEDTAATALGHGAAFTAVNGVTYDEHGHITGFSVNKFTAVNTTYKANTDSSGKVTFTAYNGKTATGEAQSVTFVGGNKINVAATAGEAGKITINHVAATPTSSTGAAISGKTYTAITGLTFDGYGHVANVEKTTLTVPDEQTYKVEGSVVTVANGVTTTTSLVRSDNQTTSVTNTITSESLAITAGTNSYSVELVWGTF